MSDKQINSLNSPDALERLVESDQSTVRVLEDVIDLLIQKNVILFTELPEAAQAKLMARRGLRKSLNPLTLMGSDDSGVI